MANLARAGEIAHLNISGYEDGMIWEKHTGTSESDFTRRGVFPITRYGCVTNRPRVLSTIKVADSPNTDFSFVITDTEEMNDDDVFELFGQSW